MMARRDGAGHKTTGFAGSRKAGLVLPRKAWRHGLAALLATALLVPSAARAEFPDRGLEVVVTFAPGGTPDVLARALSEGLQANLKQPVVVVNRLGAGGAVGGATVARAKADGYTLLFSPALIVSVVPTLQPAAGFTAESFDPICQTFESQMALIVPNESPYRSVGELVEAARTSPGKLTWGHAGRGSIPHLAGLELAKASGIQVVEVPYKGDSETIPALLGGQIDFAPITLSSIPEGRVRIIGLFAPARNPALPDVSTVKEQGFDVSPTSFGGLFGPKGLPGEVKARLEEACKAAAESPRYVDLAKSLRLGAHLYYPGAVFTAHLQRDMADKARLLSILDTK
ncbi:tripartite tricarboxylate transporter substrate binding protein [Aquabacter cavernae]|uniref:tripartite tricarboxylate transporter substrate binding protein n=1 Tax=Aquabacter cavernae TaxID=2496029 RepID=UPI000F8E571A|nr:tripartite tricarboxylate transporter substrate binding protein [Aquabacter cavernae]